MQMNFDNSSSIAKNALTNEIHAGREWTHIHEHFPLYLYQLTLSKKALTVTTEVTFTSSFEVIHLSY